MEKKDFLYTVILTTTVFAALITCLLYTSDAADE